MGKDKKLFIWFKKYAIQLTIYLIIIAAIPVLVISGSVFYGTKQIILKQVDEFSQTYLSQAITATDIVLKQVSDSCKQMAIDDVFGEFENFYRGKHYEELIHNMNISDDLVGVNQYVESKSNMFKRMNALRLSNEFVESVYLLDGRKGIVYTDVGTQYSKEEFFDKQWLKYENEDFIAPEFMHTRVARQSDGTSKEVITLLMHSYYENNNIIAVNLDAQKLYSKIRSINRQDRDMLFVLSSDGEILLQDTQYRGALDNIEIKEIDPLHTNIHRVEGTTYIFSKLESTYTGWQFVNAMSLGEYFTYISKLAILILILSGICITVVFVVAVLLAKKLYRPIKKLLNYTGYYRDATQDNEFDSIQNSFLHMQGETDKLREKLAYSLPACKEKFLLSLLKYKKHNEEEITEQLRLLDIKLSRDNLIIVIISTQITKELVELSVLGTKKVLVNELIIKIFEGMRYESVELENDKLALLMNLGEKSESEVFKKLEYLNKLLKEQMALHPIIAVSRHIDDMTEAQKGFEETNQFFKYLVVNNKTGVSGVLEGQLSSHKNIIYPKEKLDILGGYLRNGDLTTTKSIFKQILVEACAEQEKMSYEQAQLIYFEVLSHILNTITTMGIEMSMVYGGGRNLYQELIQHQTVGSITPWFNEIFEVTTTYINEGMVEHKNKHILYIIQRIEEDCGSAISLDRFAEELGLNPNYISRVFKEVTGKKFIDYLTKVRVEHSMRLLTNRQYKIKDIAIAVGYPNTNYFIKVFKEYNGITPGEFKKINATKKIE